MAYASLADMKIRYSEQELIKLTDHNRPAAQIDVARINAALDDAQALIDDALRDCYQLPLSNPTSRRLKAITCRIARRFLYDDKPTDEVKALYDIDVKYLQNLYHTRTHLLGDNGQPISDIICQPVYVIAPDKVFTDFGQYAPAADRKNVNRYGALPWGS